MRGATPEVQAAVDNIKDFNPRSPCGERRRGQYRWDSPSNFNPRSPCGERRYGCGHLSGIVQISTHAPRAGSDASCHMQALSLEISTHAPRAGSDMPWSSRLMAARYFNPRSPCGERPGLHDGAISGGGISTHAPRAGSDAPAAYPLPAPSRFQPTLPVRGATTRAYRASRTTRNFNPRSPCGERRAALMM